MNLTDERLSEIVRLEDDTPAECGEMARQIIAARSILSEWSQKSGHALCHQHPEILLRLSHALEINVNQNPPLPARMDFEIGCKEYHDFLYNNDEQR